MLNIIKTWLDKRKTQAVLSKKKKEEESEEKLKEMWTERLKKGDFYISGRSKINLNQKK